MQVTGRVPGAPDDQTGMATKLLLILFIFIGYWLFHCHIEWHVEVGMALVFKIGEDSDMPPVPKYFPSCYNYMPSQQKTTTEVSSTSAYSEPSESTTEVGPHSTRSIWWDFGGNKVNSANNLAINYLLNLSVFLLLVINLI